MTEKGGAPVWARPLVQNGEGKPCAVCVYISSCPQKRAWLSFSSSLERRVSCAAGRVCFLRCMRRVCAGANLPRCKLRKAVHVFSVRKMHVCALLAVIRFPRRRALCRMENFTYEKGRRNGRQGKPPFLSLWTGFGRREGQVPGKAGAGASLRRISYRQASRGAA